MAGVQAEEAFTEAPGADASVEAHFEPPAPEMAAPAEAAEPAAAAAAEPAAVNNNKRKAEEAGETEEEQMRKRASFNGPAEDAAPAEAGNGVRAMTVPRAACQCAAPGWPGCC